MSVRAVIDALLKVNLHFLSKKFQYPFYLFLKVVFDVKMQCSVYTVNVYKFVKQIFIKLDCLTSNIFKHLNCNL